MKNLFSVILLLISASSFANPISKTGNDILHECSLILDTKKIDTSSKIMTAGHCLGYLNGLNDMAIVWQAMEKVNHYCLPKNGLEGEQLARVIIEGLKSRPSELHESARVSFLLIMKENFPCN